MFKHCLVFAFDEVEGITVADAIAWIFVNSSKLDNGIIFHTLFGVEGCELGKMFGKVLNQFYMFNLPNKNKYLMIK